jgi:hypothetical protein
MDGRAFRRSILIAGIASLLASYTVIWLRFVHDPAERTGLDFIAFYAAGRTAQQHGDARVYDPRLQQQIEQAEVGFPLERRQVLLYNHMPFLVPVLRAIMSANYAASFYRWLSVLVIFYALGIAILSRSLRQAAMDRDSVRVTAVSASLFLPVFVSLMTGQDTAFLFVGAALWSHGLVHGRELLSGIGLSLADVRPHVALVLALPMLFRHPRVFVGFTIGSATLAVASLSILGIEGAREFVHVLSLSAGGQWYGLKEGAMYNFIGLLSRSAPGLPPGLLHAVGWLVYGASILGLCALWARAPDPKTWLVGPTVSLGLFVVPHLHLHDLALLLIPIYESIRSSKHGSVLTTSTAVALPLAISLLLLASNPSAGLRYKVPVSIMLVLAAYPCYARLFSSRPESA